MPKTVMFTEASERPAKVWGKEKKGAVPSSFEIAVRNTFDSDRSVVVGELPFSDNYMRKHFEACYPEMKLAIRKKGDKFYVWAERKLQIPSESVTETGIEFAGD